MHSRSLNTRTANREPRTATRILPPNQPEVDEAHHNERWDTYSVRPREQLNSTMATVTRIPKGELFGTQLASS